MGSLRRGFYLVSLAVFGFCFPAFVNAANYTYETVNVGNGSYAPTGVKTPITVNVKGPGVSRYHQIVPVGTKEVVGKFARSAVRGGVAGLAIHAAIEGLGYVIDGLEIKKKETSVLPGGPESNGGVLDARTTIFIPSESKTVAKQCSQWGSEYCVSKPHPSWAGNVIVYGWDCKAGFYAIENPSYAHKCFNDDTPPLVEERLVPITAQDHPIIDSGLWDSLSLQQKFNLLRSGVVSASPRGTEYVANYPVSLSSNIPSVEALFSDWPELRASYRALLNAEIAAYLQSQDPNFEPSPDESVIVDTGSELPPIGEPPIIDIEFPPFCEWASFVCSPFVGGEHPEVPRLDLEVQDYESGLPSNAACPVPVSVELSIFGTHELSYQPVCDFAGMIRIPVIAISYLIAGFIVVGVRR